MMMDEIKRIHLLLKEDIQKRLDEFRSMKNEGDEKIFAEMVFCLLTPQSKAKLCWHAVENLLNKNLLLKGDTKQIVEELKGVRFKYKKAEYVIKAKNLFAENDKISIHSRIEQFRDAEEARKWLVKNVKGMGYKEASHFLRNIGWGENLAILDRHILKNLSLLGVIQKVPDNLSKKKYMEIEKKMKKFAEKIGIKMSHLDLVLWYKETGEIFK
mgnify:CR=1 FL=1